MMFKVIAVKVKVSSRKNNVIKNVLRLHLIITDVGMT